MIKIDDIKNKFSKVLKSLYEEREINNIFNIYIEDKLSAKFINIEDLSPVELENIEADIEQLSKGAPVQYVVGKSYFYDSFFKVDKSVLIPRAETEQLVYESIKECKNRNKSLTILDIGTGSGCIALSIAKECKKSNVTGIDISPNALKIANYNKNNLKMENVVFQELDFLNEKKWSLLSDREKKIDIIVSNPPYIKEEEKKLMSTSTLLYEPHTALFPKGNDYLIFYKKIINFANKYLSANGIVLCEINEFSSLDLINILEKSYNFKWKIINDLQNKPRILKLERVNQHKILIFNKLTTPEKN